jgi:hypothetical protein
MTDLAALHNLIMPLLLIGMTATSLKKLRKVNTLKEYLDYWCFGYWIDDNIASALRFLRRALPTVSTKPTA